MIAPMPSGPRPGLIGQHQLQVSDAAQTTELFHHGELYGEQEFLDAHQMLLKFLLLILQFLPDRQAVFLLAFLL